MHKHPGILQKHQRSINAADLIELQPPSQLKIICVSKESNMIDFAKKQIDNYDPDSGNGYYQFTEANEEYVSPKTKVVLISEVSEYTILILIFLLTHACTMYVG